MADKDPWLVDSVHVDTTRSVDSERKFEDNFVIGRERLPDSEQYLASLESKLKKLKSTNSKKAGKDLLSSLEDSKKSCMYRLISGEVGNLTDQDINLDAPIDLNSTAAWLKSHVNPEQALTVGELVELIKADYLAEQSGSSENIDEEKPI
ncbi:hypothetical protein LSTR_LSTR005071 [Laodelphax striatellus]|uniref:Uncharacterized protein n=1 Tax=Laodelphax striatellus TaxID=195883 RepID=A0A482WTG7_LAOST|nr:hypothetical protein LSTR_LSTR005071 [Laodelphax striatellus]